MIRYRICSLLQNNIRLRSKAWMLWWANFNPSKRTTQNSSNSCRKARPPSRRKTRPSSWFSRVTWKNCNKTTRIRRNYSRMGWRSGRIVSLMSLRITRRRKTAPKRTLKNSIVLISKRWRKRMRPRKLASRSYNKPIRRKRNLSRLSLPIWRIVSKT